MSVTPEQTPEPRNLPPAKATTAMLMRRRAAAVSRNFKARFCGAFQCSAQEYEQQIFSRCLHRHARPFLRVLARWNPEFFREDLGLICELASAASHGEVVTELNRFYGRNVRDQNWLRRQFSLRISGKRVLKLSRKLFRDSSSSPAT